MALDVVYGVLDTMISLASEIFVGARLEQREAVSAATAVTAVTAVGHPASMRARSAM